MTAIFVCPAAAAPQIKVVPTGDSITGTYVLYPPITPITKLNAYFADTGYEVILQTIAPTGINTKQYSGHESYNYVYHDYAQDVADVNPDYILFMLGTNDVFYTNGWADFQTYIPEIFAHWQNGPKVIVASILPQIYLPDNDQRITELFNPFLQQQAGDFGFIFYDVNAMLRAQPNWQSLYHTDGVHLAMGDFWLARTMCDGVKANLPPVPEPASSLLLALGALCLLGYGWKCKWSA